MRRVLLTLFALFLAVLLGGLWYASAKGFTRKWRGYVSEEFRKRGMEVTLRQLTLDPLRGLVARDVQVFDARDRRRTLAVIDEMALQVNFANLIRGKTFLDALELREANLSLPLDPENPRGPKIDIERLNARLFLPPQQVYLARAEAEIFGLHVAAAGRLIHPEAFRQKAASRAAISPALIDRIFGEISTLKFEAEPPLVNVTFSGDLAEPDQIFADITLWGRNIRRKNYTLQTLYLAANYRSGVLDLKQVLASDSAGELRLSGRWEPTSDKVQIQLRSGLDAPALLRAWDDLPGLSDFAFYTPPHLDLRVELSFRETPAFHIIGHIETGKFAYRSLVFERASADYSWDDKRWSVRELQLVRNANEEMSADALMIPGEFRAQLRSSLDPKVLRPLLNGQAADVLAQLNFSHPPRINLNARGPEPAWETLTIEGEIAVGAASFRGVPAVSGTGKVRYADRVLSIAPLHVERREGNADGNIYFDFARDEIRLEKVRARVNPPEVAMWIDPELVKQVLPYRFPNSAPDLLIDGVVHTKRGTTTRLSIQANARSGMEYPFLGKNLSATQASAKLLFTSDRLKISDFSAALLSGFVTGEADISLVPSRPGHAAEITLEQVDFAALTKLYFGYENSHGHLSGHCRFSGRGDDARSMEGQGDLAVADGNVFAIPFLGPLSLVLDGIVPGMGRTVARHANARFTIGNGVVSTDDLVVQGTGFSMLGNGKLFFVEDRMDFDMRINAQGLPGVFLFPVSKLFEYTADQKLSKPVWRLKIVPRL